MAQFEFFKPTLKHCFRRLLLQMVTMVSTIGFVSWPLRE